MTIVKKHPEHVPATIQIEEGMIPDAVVVGNAWVHAQEETGGDTRKAGTAL